MHVQILSANSCRIDTFRRRIPLGAAEALSLACRDGEHIERVTTTPVSPIGVSLLFNSDAPLADDQFFHLLRLAQRYLRANELLVHQLDGDEMTYDFAANGAVRKWLSFSYVTGEEFTAPGVVGGHRPR